MRCATRSTRALSGRRLKILMAHGRAEAKMPSWVERMARNKSHTFGRFRVATYGRTDVAILVRHTETPVYAMRLS